VNKKLRHTFAILLAFGAILTLPSLANLKIGYDLESLFPEGDDSYQYYQSYKKKFGDENNFLLIGFECQDSILQTNYLKSIDNLGQRIEQITGVEQVYSPVNLSYPKRSHFFGFKSTPLLPWDHPKKISDSPLLNPDFSYSITNQLLSRDRRSLMMYIQFEDQLQPEDKKATFEAIRTLTRHGLPPKMSLYFAGQPNTQDYYNRKLSKELILFSSLTLLLLMITITLIYRNSIVVFAIIFTLLIALALSLFVSYWLLGRLDFLMTLMPSIILVVGISNLIHIVRDYRFHAGNSTELSQSLQFTYRSTFYSSFTSAIGFLALNFMGIIPLQHFGTYTAIGILITWVVSVLCLPTFLNLFQKQLLFRRRDKTKINDQLFRRVYAISQKKGVISLGFAIILIISIYGISKINTNVHFLDDLSEDSSLKKEVLFFEKHFGGIRPLEISINTREGYLISDPTVTQAIADIESEIRHIYQSNSVFSTTSFLKEYHAILHYGDPKDYVIPADDIELDSIYQQLERADRHGFMQKWLSADRKSSRISGYTSDVGSELNSKYEAKLIRYAKKYDALFTLKPTGLSHLIGLANATISHELLMGILFSIGLVGLLIGLMLRSLKLVFISVLPNVLPLVIVAGLMGWIGIDLKIGTALIFTVLYGIAVDDTIHFLLRYQHEKGKNAQMPILNVYRTVGVKMIQTSMILIMGFLTFCLSSFQSTFYAGLLISIGLIVALVSDFLLLPALLKQTKSLN
jgi:hypothetical protein